MDLVVNLFVLFILSIKIITIPMVMIFHFSQFFTIFFRKAPEISVPPGPICYLWLFLHHCHGEESKFKSA